MPYEIVTYFASKYTNLNLNMNTKQYFNNTSNIIFPTYSIIMRNKLNIINRRN